MKKIILTVLAVLVLIGTSVMNWWLIFGSTDQVEAYIGIVILSTVWYLAAVAGVYLSNLITKGRIKDMALRWLEK